MPNIWKVIKSLFIKPLPRPDNTGIILGNKETDYFVGANSPIEYKERLRDGNWTPYAFDTEPQSSNRGDSMACVSHSALNIIQAQEFYITGRKVNYSKRWIAKMSGTTRQGNYLNTVADTIRKYGLVLEEDYPTPESFTWDDYHADIPKDLKDRLEQKGKEWLKRWKVEYEFLQLGDANFDRHLKHAPIQVVIPGHAVAGIYSPDQFMTYLDSYSPWVKKYSSNGLLSAMKLILTPLTIQAREVQWVGHPELGLYLPFDSMQRREMIRNKLSEWLPDYIVDASKTYNTGARKPDWG